MDIANTIVFYCLAGVTIASSILAVTSQRIFRAVIYLLFVLVGSAGLYLMLNYHFLAAVQLSVYAGGVVVLFIFAVMLTSKKQDKEDRSNRLRRYLGLALSGVGLVLTLMVLLSHKFVTVPDRALGGDYEIDTQSIGYALMGSEKYGYLLPFEILGLLLLACIIGGILIARKR